jgi:hypothetical protein
LCFMALEIVVGGEAQSKGAVSLYGPQSPLSKTRPGSVL